MWTHFETKYSIIPLLRHFREHYSVLLSLLDSKKQIFGVFLLTFFFINKKSSNFAPLFVSSCASTHVREKYNNKIEMAKDIAFILYNTPEHSEKVQVVVREETLWMTQKAMSELFGVQVPAISKHLKNIFESGELQEEVVVSKMEITTPHGAMAGKTQRI